MLPGLTHTRPWVDSRDALKRNRYRTGEGRPEKQDKLSEDIVLEKTYNQPFRVPEKNLEYK